jgi:hypothetical protein
MKAIMWMALGAGILYCYMSCSKPTQAPVVWSAPKELVPDHK